MEYFQKSLKVKVLSCRAFEESLFPASHCDDIQALATQQQLERKRVLALGGADPEDNDLLLQDERYGVPERDIGRDISQEALAARLSADPFTIVTAEPPPRVSQWQGGDLDWPATDPPAEAADAVSTSRGATSTSRGKSARFEALCLPVVYQSGRTGFEEHKHFTAAVGDVIAGRYEVRSFLGSAAFSSAIACADLADDGREVCLKVIKNNKDYVDQSLDEIKLLRYLKAHGDPDAHNILTLHSYFYHKEHLFLVTELLKDNLYEFQNYLADNGCEPYFTLPRVQRIARQVLEALSFIHAKGLMHCDLKPENILIRSYSRCDVKVIDFGSSCFVTDTLSTYIQSRSYRAPEVILGLPYGPKIDVWSLGCIIAELVTGRVLFPNTSVPTLLARLQSLLGSECISRRMLDRGTEVHRYFVDVEGVPTVYEKTVVPDGEPDAGQAVTVLLSPRRTNLRIRLQTEDPLFLDFMAAILAVDADRRPTAAQALQHPWLRQELEVVPYYLPG